MHLIGLLAIVVSTIKTRGDGGREWLVDLLRESGVAGIESLDYLVKIFRQRFDTACRANITYKTSCTEVRSKCTKTIRRMEREGRE